MLFKKDQHNGYIATQTVNNITRGYGRCKIQIFNNKEAMQNMKTDDVERIRKEMNSFLDTLVVEVNNNNFNFN